MKILILANNSIGLWKFRQELLKKLKEENHDIYISCPDGEFIEKVKELGCNFIDAKISRHGKNILEDFKLLKNYIKIIQKIKPDVVLTYTIKPNIYGGIACRLLKTSYLVNITGLGTALENKSIMRKILIYLYKIALKNVNCIFFQNKENKQFFLEKGFNFKNSKLIPGSGVNLEKFKLQEYPSEKKGINFVFISRIMKEKGIDQYLEAADYIKNKYTNTNFHVCGFCEDNYIGILKEYEKKGVINYYGMVKNIQEFLEKIHCTIHPTYYPEGMSNVLLESCASGRPIITTNRSGCREIVDNNVNGYIVKQNDTKDLIEKVENFLKLSREEKKEMGLNGRKKMEKQFDRNIVIDCYLKEINKIK
ncbi:glycosyltransferase family 4 protein [Fusobacterium sp. MFO224]|uniref:glycosyltransferase family 4 protein n=1 Tax=Fusobacterium sp. MFO224 TaxID=3378070 RepID=UPI00385519B4